ncbi:hypothetical protein HYS94_00030 [Candidatus Daviesbacteria bacterium]|nr:hypothetical protein [Candidatus Daviesbacteria bacterium]
MIATEIDNDRQINRRRYVGGGASALVLLGSAPGIERKYVERTLEACLDHFSQLCEFASASHILGERNLAMEVAFEDWSDFRVFINWLANDNVAFKGSNVTQSTFNLVEDDLMSHQGLPWSDARREAYILIQTQPEWGPRVLLETLGVTTDPNYKFRTLQIIGSSIYNTLVIVSSEAESFEDGGNNKEESKSQDASQLTVVGNAVERIRTTPGVNDTMVYICSDTLDFYPYDKVIGDS